MSAKSEDRRCGKEQVSAKHERSDESTKDGDELQKIAERNTNLAMVIVSLWMPTELYHLFYHRRPYIFLLGRDTWHAAIGLPSNWLLIVQKLSSSTSLSKLDNRSDDMQKVSRITKTIICNHGKWRAMIADIETSYSIDKLLHITTAGMSPMMRAYYYTQLANIVTPDRYDEFKKYAGPELVKQLWSRPQSQDLDPYLLPDLHSIVIGYSSDWLTIQEATIWLLTL